MRNLIFCFGVFSLSLFSQETAIQDTFLKEISEQTCDCVSNIEVEMGQDQQEVVGEISKCIEEKVTALQIANSFSELSKQLETDKGTETTDKEVVINTNKKSDQYIAHYRKIEEHLISNCKKVRELVASFNKTSVNSLSKNPKATLFYNKGIQSDEAGDLKKSEKYYKKALKEDSQFAFAWDNLGLVYRKLNKYDKSIEAYENSLKIDPNGLMPLQNLPVVYSYQKKYNKAVDAYKKLSKISPDNPEVYYGIGRLQILVLNNNEEGLDNMCKAYNIYSETKSPFRSDAKKNMKIAYDNLKKQGKGKRFKEILSSNNITIQE